MAEIGAYARSGVDTCLGDKASKILYEAAKKTWENRKGKLGDVVELFSDFSGLRGIHVGSLPHDTYANLGFDGIGTKVEIAERTQRHDTVAYDLFAMVCDDAVVRGAEPVIIGSILDVNTLGNHQENYIDLVEQLAKGYVDAARAAGVAVVNGELAELGARVNGYGKFCYNWGASVLWFAKKDRLLTGYDVKEGDRIVGLKSDGFRSNGLSLVRKTFSDAFGDEWHERDFNGSTLGDAVLVPSRIYCAAVADMFGGISDEPKAKLHAVAHITGGGVEKIRRALKPSGLGADIYDPFAPCQAVHLCQDLGKIPDHEAYQAWNMGTGMMIFTPEPDKVIDVAKRHSIDAKVIGIVTNGKDIRMRNMGYYAKKEGDTLIF